jgi:hypothetical protein
VNASEQYLTLGASAREDFERFNHRAIGLHPGYDSIARWKGCPDGDLKRLRRLWRELQ